MSHRSNLEKHLYGGGGEHFLIIGVVFPNLKYVLEHWRRGGGEGSL